TTASPASQGKLLGTLGKHPFHRVPVSESCRSKLECSGAFVPVRPPRKIQKKSKQEFDDIGPIRVGRTLESNTTLFVTCTRLPGSRLRYKEPMSCGRFYSQ